MRSTAEVKWKVSAGVLRPDNTSPSGPTGFIPNVLSKGTDRQNRIGNKIVNLMVTVNFAISAFNNTQSRVRLTALVDKQADGTAPVYSELYADPTSANWHYTPFNKNWVPSRYKVIKDKMVNINIYGGNAQTTEIKTIRWKIKYRSSTFYNDGNAGDITDIIRNSIVFVVASDQGTATAPVVGVEYTFFWRDS